MLKLLKRSYIIHKQPIQFLVIYHLLISLGLFRYYFINHPIEKIITWTDAFRFAIPHLKSQIFFNIAPYIVLGLIKCMLWLKKVLIMGYLSHRNRIKNIYMGLNIQNSLSKKHLKNQIESCFLLSNDVHCLGIAGWETLGAREKSELWDIIKKNKNKEITIYLLNPNTTKIDPVRKHLTILQARVEDLNVGRNPSINEEEYKSWINTTIKVIKELNSERDSLHKIKYCLYDEKPIWRCYFFQETVFFSYYQAGIHGHHSTTFHVCKRTDEFNTLYYVFDSILHQFRHKYSLQI